MAETKRLLFFFLVFQLITITSNGLFVNPTLVQSDAGAGFGNGIGNWIVYLPGGAWCATPGFCIQYAADHNITLDPVPFYFGNILDNDEEKNPDFFDWNKVVITYCDGSSFTGDSQTIYNGTNLYFRGARIFDAVMQELLQKGMIMAHNVSWTFKHNATINNCIVNCTTCSSEIYKVLQDLRLEFLSLLPNQTNSLSKGVLITSLTAHGQEPSRNWDLDMVIEGSNETIAKLFRDWYFDRRGVYIIDKYPYPYLNNCSSVPKEPTDECWKLILGIVQADGINGRQRPGPNPSLDCCSKVLNTWGFGCYWTWVNNENDKLAPLGGYDVELVFFNGENTWAYCERLENVTNPRYSYDTFNDIFNYTYE
nr:pectin acetylesterase 8-like [Ipomoea batatas]